MTPGFTGQIAKETRVRLQTSAYPPARVEKFCRLVERIEREILPHDVIVRNHYTKWFERGQFDRTDVRHFLTQFSVFSNFFIVAQLLKTINAPTLEAMHASKEILMNELGVTFRNPDRKTPAPETAGQDLEGAVESEGTVDGSVFRFSSAHFEWLLRMTTHLGLSFREVGKRRHATKSTVFFCDELARIYGSEDPSTALGASFAVENWAAAGFWKELIRGLQVFKKREAPGLPLGFFTWHDMVEDQHAQHTWDELEEEFFAHEDVDEDRFISGGVEMLNGVLSFWNGLNSDRLAREPLRKVAS
jgi:pyrroloquinoline quinone (PQQ) biosynthesis protein C